FDPAYRIFESFINDCRWSGNRPCPIVNCPAAAVAPAGLGTFVGNSDCNGDGDPLTTGEREEQVLDLTKATLEAESSGALAALLPDPPPVVTIPANLRGDETYPRLGGGTPVFNNYEFYSLWAVSEVLIADVFDLVIDVDLHRFDEFGVINSDDPSDVDLPADADAATRLAEVADRSNAVIHNRDTYNTVPRGFPEDVDPDSKSGVLIDASIGSKGAKGFQWSAVTYGLQTYYDSAAGYLDLAKQQLFELQAHKDAFLCSQFEDPDMVLVGPTLSAGDCAFLQGKLDQVNVKSNVCHAALLQPQQGASRENCSALFTQIDNLLATLDTQITPPALTDFAIIEPNYLGEFKSRVLAYRFTTEEWLLPVTPNGGIAIPGP
ncbi:MAG: hypothetical protein OES79_13595, partial [Planctomycetota bacterium]|nr:hypothetical protein [Planctomycetota bacterium]